MKKFRPLEFFRMQWATFLLILFVWVSSWATMTAWSGIHDNRSTTIAVQTLRSLYEFENLVQFGENIAIFETLVTPDVFKRMTADNTDRILRVYLKFNGRPSYVNVIEAGKGYIVYSLVCEAIERERVFLFNYEINGGKISAIREAELFTFATTRGWDADLTLPFPLEIPIGR